MHSEASALSKWGNAGTFSPWIFRLLSHRTQKLDYHHLLHPGHMGAGTWGPSSHNPEGQRGAAKGMPNSQVVKVTRRRVSVSLNTGQQGQIPFPKCPYIYWPWRGPKQNWIAQEQMQGRGAPQTTSRGRKKTAPAQVLESKGSLVLKGVCV